MSIPLIAYVFLTPSLNMSLFCFSIALFFIVGSQGVGSAVIWELWDRIDVSKAYGLSVTRMVVAGAIASYLMGYIVEVTGSFALAYYLFAGGAFLSGISAPILHRYEEGTGHSEWPKSRPKWLLRKHNAFRDQKFCRNIGPKKWLEVEFGYTYVLE